MSQVAVVVYGRGFSERSAHAQTIASPVAALRDRTTQAGAVRNPASECIDPGDGGATPIHLTLEQRQAAVAASEVERLDESSPERLARQYPSQVIRVDEFLRTRVELIFLNRSVGHSLEPAYAQEFLLRSRSPRQSLDVTIEINALATPRRRLS